MIAANVKSIMESTEKLCEGKVNLKVIKAYAYKLYCMYAPRGGTPYNGLYGEAPPRKGYLFQASGILKGRDFTSLGI